ncbi:hypothetical protein GLP25_17985 [Photobacterium phosphoreum]|uniref:hypothetical protein n=1 Tax=Photobacterium phosphoreum TaxID=659 RepID=UPI001E5A0737|nr:hypothetical protein [Photobacterium phosphoreum]MCD9485057.1 hypothetical protein [Photobacterium phosphoreum]
MNNHKIKVLFSESKEHYTSLGLYDDDDFIFEFDGMRFYKNNKIGREFDAFVCGYYSLCHNLILSDYFKLEGKPTFLISDGIFDFANSFYNRKHVKDGFFLFFPIYQDYFISADKNCIKYISNSNFKSVKSYLSKRVVGEMLVPLPIQKKILITTANSSYFNTDEFEQVCDLISDIISILKNKEINFSVRIYDKKIIESIDLDGIFNDINTDFEKCLISYSSIITTPSSISILAMKNKRSVMHLIYRTTPQNIQCAWNVYNSIVFERDLDGFLNHDEIRIKQQNIILNTLLPERDINEVIKSCISDYKKKEEDKEIENFKKNIYHKMLTSKFNFNIEYSARKIFNKIRKHFKFIF